MLRFLPGHLNGLVTLLLVYIHTFFWGTILFGVSIIRYAIPVKKWQKFCTSLSLGIGEIWVSFNHGVFALTKKIEWDIRYNGEFSRDESYLVLANHQSWVDIVILNRMFLRKIPFLRYFLKKELIWVPVLGMAWTVMDFPFMKRYSREYLEKHPHLQGKDIEITRKTCEKYKGSPVAIMNFVEGTRFSEAKHAAQKSPYKNLLKPKAGGIAFVMDTMGSMLNKIADVTIYYPEGMKTFWEFLCGKVTKIVAHVTIIPITDDLRGDYQNDKQFALRFQNWLNDLWEAKDDLIETRLKKEHS